MFPPDLLFTYPWDKDMVALCEPAQRLVSAEAHFAALAANSVFPHHLVTAVESNSQFEFEQDYAAGLFCDYLNASAAPKSMSISLPPPMTEGVSGWALDNDFDALFSQPAVSMVPGAGCSMDGFSDLEFGYEQGDAFQGGCVAPAALMSWMPNGNAVTSSCQPAIDPVLSALFGLESSISLDLPTCVPPAFLSSVPSAYTPPSSSEIPTGTDMPFGDPPPLNFSHIPPMLDFIFPDPLTAVF